MRFQRLFILCVVLALPVSAMAQQAEEPEPTVLVIDLTRGTKQVLPVDAATYKVRLTNAVPGREYFLRFGPSQALQQPLLASPNVAETLAPPPAQPADKESCPTLAAARTELASAEREADVAIRVDRVRLAMVSAGECPNEKAKATEVVSQTRPEFSNKIQLDEEAVRDITVASGFGGRWDIRLNSAGRGVWQNSFGFVFSPNHDEDYYTEETGAEAFTIRRKTRDKNSITLLPSVFYTWLPSSQAFKSVQYGPTLGVGLTTDSGRISGMLGWSFRFNQNIGVTVGVNVYPHHRLDGKYHEGQVLKEALDSDQLNKDSVRGNIFVAFTLRLGASPFGG